MNLEHLPLRILLITYRRAVELDLDDDFIKWIKKEIQQRENEKEERSKKANL
ncbi:sporulation histidine kinase inhibitor Sda [Halobacillus sp. Marseille-P3879]|uniref:sporulation histidine kinase inhibitor Sda n=1 Tax=Halobacillus TaxID=45667 RepID=UPI000C79CC84|nr:sporulation histidine kinase inhibitor Sda [Halobacillus sp. Marseille-P3879]